MPNDSAKTTPDTPAVLKKTMSDDQAPLPGEAAENVRRRLRAMMAPNTERPIPAQPGLPAYARLKTTALTGNNAFFQTALADALDIDFRTARSITEKGGYSSLIDALKALDLPEEQAFLLAATVFPGHFGSAEAVRLFLERYRLLHRDVALDKVREWKAASLGARVRANEAPRRTSQGAPNDDHLKAS